jgi:hypothetical protein
MRPGRCPPGGRAYSTETNMATHRLHAEMLIDRPIDDVFALFAKPENLGRVTPRSLGRPLMERMPRRLTPFDEGLATYLGPTTVLDLTIDGSPPTDATHEVLVP